MNSAGSETSTACYACRLASGEETLVGGRIAQTRHWLVEHCMGPLGVGTLIVKPKRHVLHVHALSDQEAVEMGSLLKEAARVVNEITRCSQVYISLWSHADWKPSHIHYVVQPIQLAMKDVYSAGAATLQSEMFRANQPLPKTEVVAFCEHARRIIRVAVQP